MEKIRFYRDPFLMVVAMVISCALIIMSDQTKKTTVNVTFNGAINDTTKINCISSHLYMAESAFDRNGKSNIMVQYPETTSCLVRSPLLGQNQRPEVTVNGHKVTVAVSTSTPGYRFAFKLNENERISL